jgi:hypothetical protein
VLDRHERRAKAHDHPFDVAEKLIARFVVCVTAGHLDADLLDGARVESCVPQLAEQAVTIGDTCSFDLNGLAHGANLSVGLSRKTLFSRAWL